MSTEIATEVATAAVEAAQPTTETTTPVAVTEEAKAPELSNMEKLENAVAPIMAEKAPNEVTKTELAELAELKAKLAQYEARAAELEKLTKSFEEEVNIYRPKKDLLSELDGLNPKALKALKQKDFWEILDASGLTEDIMYEKIAQGRPKLSMEELVEKRFREMEEATKLKEQQSIRERELAAVNNAKKQVSSWLDLTDEKQIGEDLVEAHEILKFAKQDEIIDVEQTLIDMVSKSGITYPEAVKTLANVLEEKALRMTMLKALDKKLSTRYKPSETPVAKAQEVTSNEKEVIKTLGSKIEDAPKVILENESINGKESFDEMIAKAKKNLSRIPTKLR